MTPHIGWPAVWSSDSKAIYSYRSDSVTGRIPIVVRNLETNREKELYNLTFSDSSYYASGLALSRDGQQLAFSVSESGSKIIKVMPTAGGEVRDLLRGDKSLIPIASGTIVWAPDGQSILFSKQISPGSFKTGLWLIPIQGGEPRKLDLAMENMHDLSIHPDGRHIAFTSSQTRSELWVMDNFLPKEKIETSNQLTLSKLDYPQLNVPFARLSPDSKKMAYVVYDGNTPKRIDILDLSSGTAKVLIDSGASGESTLVWSPGSDKIAYTFQGKELRVRDIEGTNSHVLLKNSGDLIYPTDWSRDGKKILCFFVATDRPWRIGTVTSDGHIQFLGSGNSIDFRSEAKISPDGAYVACTFEEKEGNTNIYVWTSDGSRKVRVTEHPGRDENPVWSPDGKYIAFLSDRNRSVDLWGVQMKDGATVGAPFVIKRDLGWRTRIYDFTANGKLSMLMVGGAEPANLFTVPVDQESGSLSGTITPISVYPTDHFFPKYSPNGKMIAYLSRKGQIGFPKLFVLDENGAERELPLQGHFAVNVAWNPDNRSLFFAGMDKTFKAGIYEISLEKEEIRSVYIGEMVDMKTYKGALINVNLLPDVRKLMFFRWMEKGNVDVLTCETDGLQPTVVLEQVKMPVWGLPSSNGKNICYRVGDSLMVVSVSNGAIKNIGCSTGNLEATWAPDGENLMFREGSGLKIFSLKENSARTLYQAPAGKTVGGMEMYANSWSPNGSRFIITEKDTSAKSFSPQKVIMINLVNGSVSTLGDAPKGYPLSELRWSPDGSKITATGESINSARAPIYEYWVMENFLPK
jgi:Tol biopolymer transport system component